MLEKIRVKDFQCHEDLKIEFDPKITAIVGPSDAGKSAVLRAIRWVATNRPLGDGFIRHGATTSVVKLWSDDGSVTRRRGSQNTYAVDGQVLEAFGAEVPVDVTKVLKIDSVNFQGQHEPPFWFSLSPGEVAKQLNAIVDLSLIDHTLKELNSLHRSVKAKVSVCEDRLKSIKGEFDALSWVKEVDGALKEVEEIERQREAVTNEWEALQKQLDNHLRLDRQRALVVRLVSSAEDAFDLGKGLRRLIEERVSLDSLLGIAENHQRLLKVDLPTTTTLDAIASALAGARADHEAFSSLVFSADDGIAYVKELAGKCEEKEAQLLEETGGRCPVCGGPLK